MSLFGPVFFIYILAIMSPGPDFVLVAKNALHSRKLAILTSLGIGLGVFIHLSYCVIGLSFINPYYMHYLKRIGGCWLLYIGFSNLVEDHNLTLAANSPINHSLKALSSGLFCNLLNPKAILFFLALFTTLKTNNISLSDQYIYAFIMIAATFAWFISISHVMTIKSIRLKLVAIQSKVIKFLSVILILFGIYLLVLS